LAEKDNDPKNDFIQHKIIGINDLEQIDHKEVLDNNNNESSKEIIEVCILKFFLFISTEYVSQNKNISSETYCIY